ncbi:TIR domain-containing protein [Cryobacterium sp. PAMC25264]|uniref:TIR domain-containing protein n=1 Tax=Cryobacterium sp. PAMC25264 TaxID=2861288 RepID=UPI001C6394A2|nr:nucleotide-binding protein [Cryobacterium sp. PAMC25264]QYF74753.1 nucleotide-binding protein [Cryobacterium sp. PAMC25264]
MPSKTTTYPRVHFPPETIASAFTEFTALTTEMYAAAQAASPARTGEPETTAPAWITHYGSMTVEAGNDRWSFDTHHEFFEELRKPHESASVDFGIPYNLQIENGLYLAISIGETRSGTQVSIRNASRAGTARLSAIFEAAAPTYQSPEPSPEPIPKPRIFVGHGGKGGQWRDLKDHLTDVHGYEVVAFESGARAGNVVRDVLSSMLDASTFAILVMTGEDAQDDGTMRARQNVVHEAGLFQGRLGFSRAIILLEDGTANFSNLDGIQYIPFSAGNIRETFGDVLGTIRREFPPA